MPASTLAIFILTPFIVIFAYAGWHEWRRVRKEGQGNYGLAYDSETDTTHVTLLEEGETGYDPETDSAADETEETGARNDPETDSTADETEETGARDDPEDRGG